MRKAVARLRNALIVASLASRNPRFARAIAARRFFEALYTRVPRLCSALPCPYPVEVVIALTSRCQLNCSMCGIRRVMAQPEFRGSRLDPADIFPLIDEIAGWTFKPYIKFTGGEPLLLREDLVEMVEACHLRGIPTRVSTNGCLLSRGELAHALVKSGLDVLTISLDGPPDVHNAIRGRTYAFSLAMRGIENIATAKASLPSHTPLLQVSTVIHAGNQSSLKELFKILRPLPIQWWNLQLLNFVSPEADKEARDLAREWGYREGPWSFFSNEPLRGIDAEALARDIAWIEAQQTPFAKSVLRIGGSDQRRLEQYYYEGGRPLKEKICAIPFFSLHIVPTGDMVFCIDYPYVVYGNIRQGSLRREWVSEEAKKYRKRLLGYYSRTGKNLPQCSRCNWLFN